MVRYVSQLFFLSIFLVILVGPTYAISGESFSQYRSVVNFTEDGTILITKNLALKNNYDRSILPGQIEFRIGKGTLDSVTSANLENVKAFDRNGRNITYTIREYDDYSSLILDIYYPLLPKFEYKFTLAYELEFEASGIFFKSLQVPLKESSIPIENGVFEVYLPENRYFTYLGELDEFASIDGNHGVWELGNNLPNSVEFEYSLIPIRSSWMRGSYLFWVIINVLMFIFLVREIRKEVIRVKAEMEE